ncbi:hypothetical protein [Roseateles sp. MS654]|uniref:hypothetical protein n=1 Tax=Roseateles sp. MS654 TaxID=3412685 RepID=UPI003C2D5656
MREDDSEQASIGGNAAVGLSWELRKRSLVLVPLDIVCLILGMLTWWSMTRVVSSAMAFGEVDVMSKYRGGKPETVAWPEAWALLAGGGWVVAIFLYYLWNRATYLAGRRNSGLSNADIALLLSVVPAASLYLFSGWLLRVSGALKLLLCLLALLFPMYVAVRFGKWAGLAIWVAELAAVAGWIALR